MERARALRKNVEQHYVSRQPPIEPSECIRTNGPSVNSDCRIASLTQQKASAYAGFAPSRCAPGSTALAGAAGPAPPELHGTASSSRQAYAAFLVHQKTPSLITTYKFYCHNIYRSVRQSQPANSLPRSALINLHFRYVVCSVFNGASGGELSRVLNGVSGFAHGV